MVFRQTCAATATHIQSIHSSKPGRKHYHPSTARSPIQKKRITCRDLKTQLVKYTLSSLTAPRSREGRAEIRGVPINVWYDSLRVLRAPDRCKSPVLDPRSRDESIAGSTNKSPQTTAAPQSSNVHAENSIGLPTFSSTLQVLGASSTQWWHLQRVDRATTHWLV
jgi:hypothetical protein